MKQGDLPVCVHCGEVILEGEPVSDIKPGPYHHACGFRLVAGGLNHVLKRCSCFGGTEPPDPPGMALRAAAQLCLMAYRTQDMIENFESGAVFRRPCLPEHGRTLLDDQHLYNVAKQICHDLGIEWRDPRTNILYPPPAKD